MPRQSGGCDVGLLLGDEGMAGGREAVAIVEDVTAHLGELLGAVGVERFALLVGGPCRPLLIEQPLVIATPRQLSGVVEHPLVEGGRWTGQHRVDEPIEAASAAPIGRRCRVRSFAVVRPTRRGRT